MSGEGVAGISPVPGKAAEAAKPSGPRTAGGKAIDPTTQKILTDVEAGKESVLGQEFAPGSLERLDTARSQDVSDIIAKRRAGLEGLSAEENQALRERGSQGITRGTQTALRQLRGRQAASGVRGGTATAQQAAILSAGQQAKAGVERDLFLQNINQKRQALGDFEKSVAGAEQSEEARRLFNIEQQQREKFGRVSAGLGIAQLGVAERAGIQAAQAARSAGRGGGKK